MDRLEEVHEEYLEESLYIVAVMVIGECVNFCLVEKCEKIYH